MAGLITHSWNGTILTITSDSGTSSADLKGSRGDLGPRGPQGPAGIIINPDGTVNYNGYATEQYVDDKFAEIIARELVLDDYYTKAETLLLIPDTTGFATKVYVDNAIANSNVKVDLSNYYTKKEVDAKIPDTSGYITNTALESKGYQTEAQVQALINSTLAALDGDGVKY
jgi:hypothetical protein